jgi:PAS domain S-box-containing protein
VPVDAFYFIALLATASLLVCLIHLARARITLGPVFALVGILVLLLWQMRRLGWWMGWGDLQVDAALVGLVPAILSGVILVYAMDGIQAARAYLLVLVITGLIGWGFAEMRDELVQKVPIPFAFELSSRSNLGVLLGLLSGGLFAIGAYEAARRLLLPLAMPLALYAGVAGFLIPASYIEYGAQIGWANIREQAPEFALFTLLPAILLFGYGLLARHGRVLMPPRHLGDLVRFWRSAETSLQATRQDVMDARRSISELRQLNQALEESRRINEYQVMHSPLGVIYTDLRGRIDFANPAALALTGIAERSLLGRPLAGLFETDSGLDLSGLAASGQALLLRLAEAGSAETWCELTAMQLFGRGGEKAGYHLLLKDVTASRQAQRLKRIEDRVKGIHQTGRVIVHDFSNLLLGMQGRLAELNTAFGERDATTFDAGVEMLQQGIRRGREMLQQLGAGEVFGQPRLRTVALGSMLREAVNICLSSAREKGISLQSRPFSVVEVKADPSQITRVLTNLLLNALRATPAGGAVRLEVEQEGEGGVVRICDTGPGMSEKQLEQAFEPGFSSKGSGQGGLGLSIACLIVDAHAGRLQLQSRPEETPGICASVWLPRADGGAPAMVKGTNILVWFRQQAAAEAVLGRLDALEPAGLAEIRSEEELLAVAEEESWGLLVTDVTPPALPGLRQATLLVCSPEHGLCRIESPGQLTDTDVGRLVRHLGWRLA